MLLLIIIIAAVAIFVAYQITKKDGTSVETTIQAPEKIEPLVEAPKKAVKKTTDTVKKPKAKKVK